MLTLAIATGCVAALLALASRHPLQPQGLLAAIVLAAAFCAAEIFPVHLRTGHETHTISFNEVPLAIGVVCLAPVSVVATIVVGAGFALVVHRGQRGAKLAFNLAQLAAQAITATAVFTLIHRGAANPTSIFIAAAIGLVAADFVSTILVTAAIALHQWTVQNIISAQAILRGAIECLPKAVLAALAVLALNTDQGAMLIAVLATSTVAYLFYRSIAWRTRGAAHLTA